MARLFQDLSAFEAAVGEELGTSDWITVTQEMVDQFAVATGDHQWIHVDPVRAAKGPYGGTIAHGYLTLALIPIIAMEIYRVENLANVVNYGADRLRFPHPVPVGSRIRGTASLTSLKKIPSGSQALISFVVSVEGVEKPACVADVIYVLSAA